VWNILSYVAHNEGQRPVTSTQHATRNAQEREEGGRANEFRHKKVKEDINKRERSGEKNLLHMH
jgi:hypothetical protein